MSDADRASAAHTRGDGAPAAGRPQVTARHVTSGFGWLALCQYSNRFLGLASTLILAKLLTPDDFGIVAIASMIIEAIQLLRDMGLSEAVIASRREDRAALDTAHTVLVGYNTLLFLVAAAASPFVARFYGNDTLIPIVILMSSNLVINSLRLVPMTLIRRNLDYRKLVLPDVVPTTISSIVGIVLAFIGFGVWSLVIKTLVQSVLAMVFIQFIIPYRPRFAFDRGAARELYGYGKFVVGSSVLFVTLYNVDRLFVSKIAGIAAFGAYELAARISDMPARQFSGLVGAVMFPVFSRLERTGAALRQTFLRTLKYSASITFPMATGLAAFGPTIIDRIYGSRWQALGPLLRVVALYAALRATSSIIHDLFKAMGRPDLMQRATLIRLIAVVVLGAPAVAWYGSAGIAWLLVGAYVSVLVWELSCVSTLLNVPLARAITLLAKPVALALTVIPGGYAAITWFWPLTSLWQVGVGCILCGSGYVLALLAVDEDIALDVRRLLASFRRPATTTP